MESRKARYAVGISAMSGALAFAAILLVTAEGPGVSPDSTVYIRAARSLDAGLGISVNGEPLTHFPPLYPLFLATSVHLAHGESLRAARFLGALLFGVNVALLSNCVRIYSRNSLVATACGALAILSSAQALLAHAMVWSEGLFLACVLSVLLILSRDWRRPITQGTRILLLFFTALAMLTRYVGVALLPIVGVALFVREPGPLTRRTWRTFISIAAACAPIMGWALRNFLVSGKVTNRTFAVHPLTLAQLDDLLNGLSDLVFTSALGATASKLLLLGLCSLIAVSLLFLIRRIGETPTYEAKDLGLPVSIVALVISYISVLGISMTFFDAATSFDQRILLPVSVALTIPGIVLPWKLAELLRDRRIWYGGVLLLFAPTLILNSRSALVMAVSLRANPRGYSSREWRQSETVRGVMRVSAQQVVYSNGADALEFLMGRTARELPWKQSPTSGITNPNYANELKALALECRTGVAVIVYFDSIDWRGYLPSRRELEGAGLSAPSRFADGAIYGPVSR